MLTGEKFARIVSVPAHPTEAAGKRLSMCPLKTKTSVVGSFLGNSVLNVGQFTVAIILVSFPIVPSL